MKLATSTWDEVEAFDREGKVRLASGRLMTVDNQIDVATGTVKLKAEFANRDNALFPNQFVNVRLRVDTRHGVTLVPLTAVCKLSANINIGDRIRFGLQLTGLENKEFQVSKVETQVHFKPISKKVTLVPVRDA